ncbi:protein-export membrane protein SecF [Thermoactinomyces sp. DSM 45891]|uniref:protein translocase subunit SecF n=1 Tax=Thermoactinomyces sp. DSM 45891 TaxID=1761907 RepID=UPI00092433E3|nr:protein translocase subunit SecF [Thermoactinomyces sp. DSM 45891]SFX08430.1 protein-export membrane protein SecF [Thermoactinomyces sp. DSM 45891]
MNYKFNFVRYRKPFLLASLIIVLIGIGSLFIQGLNLGVDFVSGTRLDFTVKQNVDVEKAKSVLENNGFKHPNARAAGDKKEIVVFRTESILDKPKIDKLAGDLSKEFDVKVTVQEQKVDPIIGRELARNAIIGVLIACAIIGIYIAFRFEYRFAMATVATLLYDAFLIITFFSLFQIEVDLFFIAAILTIIGYSMNDTIVVFDRIRENEEKLQPKTWEQLSDMVNQSIQQTLVRSINTVLTVLFGAVSLFLLGGEGIRNFSLALVVGLLAGAYSSIFIASQTWVMWKWRSIKAGKEEPKLSPTTE